MNDPKPALPDSTRRFLEQMEKRRLARPCMKPLDMRGRVPGECRPLQFGDRTFHLDDISLAIFKRGLELNRGVFTEGMYEAIVNGPHTNRALEEQRRRQAREEPPVQAPERVPGPEVVTFGYLSRRREARVQYATPVVIQVGDEEYRGSTVNLSVHGMLVHLRGRYELREGQVLRVQMPELCGERAPPAPRPYRVRIASEVGVDRFIHLSVEPGALSAADEERLAGFIENYRVRNKLDIADEVRDVTGRLHERLFCENLPAVALFIGGDAHGAPRLKAAAPGTAAPDLGRFFADGSGYDFGALAAPALLEQLLNHGELLVAVQRDGREARWATLLPGQGDARAQLHAACKMTQTRLLKLVLTPGTIHHPPPRRLSGHTGPALPAEGQEQAHDETVHAIDAVAVAFDLTPDAERSGSDLGAPSSAPAWQPGGDPPAPVDFRRLRARRETRYRGRTPVVVSLGREKLEGVTLDISVNGLGLELRGAPAIEAGTDLAVGLPTLQNRRPALSLMRIPYRVVRAEPAGTGTRVLLRRLKDKHSEEVEEFFRELIEQNLDKVVPEVEPPTEIVTAHAYEALLCENAPAIPFFFGRDGDKPLTVQNVALTEHTRLPLADFFRGPDGHFDFSPLNGPEVRLALSERLMKLQRYVSVYNRRPEPLELELFCWREESAELGFRTVCVVASQLSPERRAELLERLLTVPERRFIKAVGSLVEQPEYRILKQTVHTLHRLSTYHSLNLDTHLQSVEGCGLLFDVTREVEAFG